VNALPNASSGFVRKLHFTLEKLRSHPETAPLFRIREASLFVHHFDLLVDYPAGEPVDRNMHPIPLFPFDDEVRQARRSGRVFSALGYYVNQ
jgi:hypothetical protein